MINSKSSCCHDPIFSDMWVYAKSDLWACHWEYLMQCGTETNPKGSSEQIVLSLLFTCNLILYNSALCCPKVIFLDGFKVICILFVSREWCFSWSICALFVPKVFCVSVTEVKHMFLTPSNIYSNNGCPRYQGQCSCLLFT